MKDEQNNDVPSFFLCLHWKSGIGGYELDFTFSSKKLYFLGLKK